MAFEYRLLGRLEEGQLAELYRAQRDGGPPVVVKLFHEKTSVASYAQQIAETSNQLAAVSHPGIAQVVDIGLVKRRLAIVREDKGGYTLGQVLQRLNTREVVLSSALAIGLVIDLLEALQLAHDAGVVHGAMTPGNVLLSAEGRPAICDFGALQALNATVGLKKSFAGRGRSTYRAPEVGRGEALSVQSDVYSLGAMSYELLTLKEAAGEAALMSTRQQAVAPPSRLDRRLNSRIDPIVMRAIDPVPGRRYKSAVEMAQALREFLTHNGGLPPREDLKRFVEQLFPPDAQWGPAPQVPFTESFTLASVEGASLADADDRGVEVADRSAFSGAFEMVTMEQDAVLPAGSEPIGERPTEWHAPPAAMPVTARSGPKESLNPDVLKRVRRIEDFVAQAAPEDTLPQGVLPGREAEVSKTQAVLAEPTIETSALGSESTIGSPVSRRLITEERNIASALAAKRRWLPIVAGSALLAFTFLAVAASRWQAGVEVQPHSPPRPIERPRPTPVKRPAPAPAPAAPVTPPDPPPRPVPVEECYQLPKKGPVGFLSVSAGRPIAVRIDGDPVCGSLHRIPVSAGPHKVRVIDTRTQEEYVSTQRIEAGRQSKLLPLFRGK